MEESIHQTIVDRATINKEKIAAVLISKAMDGDANALKALTRALEVAETNVTDDNIQLSDSQFNEIILARARRIKNELKRI
jgi:hypothetical protein